MTIEEHLQLLTGEVVSHNSPITDGAHLDVAMYGFWGSGFKFIDVRVFKPMHLIESPESTHICI